MNERIDFFDGPQRSQLHIVPVGAAPGGECYLIFTEAATLLLDCGFNFCGDQLVENLKNALQGRDLDYVLLTHSHYDHALGSPYCKHAWPNVQVVADRHAAAVFEKPGARRVMRELDAYQAAHCGYSSYPDRIDELHVDRIVSDGDTLQLGADTLQVLWLPGHTRCCIGFYFVEKQILLAPETLGVPCDQDVIMPSYLVGYQMTLDSIARAQQLPLREIFTPHAGMLYGDDCQRYLELSAACCRQGQEIILAAYQRGENLEQMIEHFRDAFFPHSRPELYPEAAFQTNVRVQIPLILRECAGVSLDTNAPSK